MVRYLKSGSFYWCYENNLGEHDDVTLWCCRSTLARVTSPHKDITSHGYTSGIRCRSWYLGGNDKNIKNISKSKFNIDNPAIRRKCNSKDSNRSNEFKRIIRMFRRINRTYLIKLISIDCILIFSGIYRKWIKEFRETWLIERSLLYLISC